MAERRNPDIAVDLVLIAALGLGILTLVARARATCAADPTSPGCAGTAQSLVR